MIEIENNWVLKTTPGSRKSKGGTENPASSMKATRNPPRQASTCTGIPFLHICAQFPLCGQGNYIPDTQCRDILYAIHGSMGELWRRSDEHDGARADHPAHRLHLHPLRHLVHRHVPECCAHASFGDQLILILGKILMILKFSPDSHPKQFGGLVKGCMGCHRHQHLTNLRGKKFVDKICQGILSHLNTGLSSHLPVRLASQDD